MFDDNLEKYSSLTILIPIPQEPPEGSNSELFFNRTSEGSHNEINRTLPWEIRPQNQFETTNTHVKHTLHFPTTCPDHFCPTTLRGLSMPRNSRSLILISFNKSEWFAWISAFVMVVITISRHSHGTGINI